MSERSSTEERRRIVKWGLITSLANRAAVALVPLLMVPLALGHLGAANYGVWTATASLTAIVGFADLGVGVGLMTRLGELGSESKDRRRAQDLIAAGYLATSAVAAILLAVIIVLGKFYSLSDILGIVNPADPATSNRIILITLGAVCVNVPVALIVRIQYGLGKQARSNVWQVSASFGALGAAAFVSSLTTSPTWFIAAIAICPPAFGLINTAVFFASLSGKAYLPAFSSGTTTAAFKLLKIGAPFLAVTVVMTLSMSLDPWIVSRSLGTESVAEFVIPQKLFLMLTSIAVTLGAPLWPLHSRAVATGDHEWINAITIRLSVALAAVVGILGISATLLAPLIIDLWLGGQIRFDLWLWISLSVYSLLQATASPFFMAQNGATILRPQLLGYLCFAAIALPAKLAFGATVGAAGIVMIGAVGYLLIIWPVCVVGYRQTIHRAKGNAKT